MVAAAWGLVPIAKIVVVLVVAVVLTFVARRLVSRRDGAHPGPVHAELG